MNVSGFVYYQPGFEHVNYKTTSAAQCYFIIVYDHFTLGCNTIMALVEENKIFIRQTSRILAMDLIYHISDISNGTLYNQRTKILYNTVHKSMARYITLLSRICNDMFDDFDILSTLRTIADDQLFRDKSCNWGRIISLFTFCGVLVRQSVSKEMYTTIDDINIFIGSYIANHLTDWIYNQGGWVSIFRLYCGDLTSRSSRRVRAGQNR